MEILKRSLSAFLALVLVLGMLPMPATASELDIMEIAETEAAQAIVPVETAAAEETAAETELPEPTAAVETLPASEPEETVPALTEPAETEAAVTEPAVTESPETQPEETEPAQTEAQETEPEETEPEETEPRRNRTPLPRDDSYWYVEEKTRTYTDTVTRVIDNGDGSFSSYDETQTITDTYLERQEVSLDGGVSAMSLTQNGENNYYFTTFADLKELAAMSFDTWAYAWYEGDEPLTIEESLTLPRYLSLEFYNDNAELIVPAGVTFTIRSGLYVDCLTVAGTLNLASYSRVYKELHVTGQILVESSLMVNSDAVVTGAQNVVAANEWNGPRWYYQDVKSADALEAALSAINRDTSGWKYRIDMSTYDSAITLDRSLFIPGNVELTVNGNNALIIARGSTLTVYGSNVYMNVPLEVRGNLVNESENFNLQSTMSVTGSYSGSGTLYVYASDWTDVVTGLDTANMLITEEREGCWKIRDMSGLTRLGTPQNPTWNKRQEWIDGDEMLVDRYGSIAWQPGEPDDNEARVRVYNQTTGQEIGSYGWGFGGDNAPAWRTIDSFILDDPESGTYYFTVTSTAYNNADIYYDSEPAVSGTWTYQKPNAALSACTNLRFENLTASWTAPAGVPQGTEYEVEWYYCDSQNGEFWNIGATWGFQRTSAQLNSHQMNGKGYYSFRVRAISDDITRTCNGAWTELSQPFYYDPDTFRFTETYLQQLLDADGYIDVYVPVVLENNFTIPEASGLYIGSGGSITVPSGKTLTVNSGGTIEYGSLLVEGGGRLAVNKYSLYVNEGGTLDVQGSYTRSGDYSYIYQTFKQGSAVSTVNGVAKKDMGAQVIVSDTLTWAEDVAILRDTGFGRTELLFRGNVTIPGNFTIPEKCIVTVSYDASLTIPQGVKLTVDGLGMYIYGEVNNYGTIDNDWDIYVDGPYSKLNNYGTINILQPSNSNYFTYLYIGEEGHVVNNGTVNVYKNGQVSIRGTWEGNAPVNRGGTVSDGEEPVDLFQQFKDYLEECAAGNGIADWSDTVTLGGNLTIPADLILCLMDGGTIIVPSGKTLTVNGDLTIAPGCGLIIERGGKLVLNGYIQVHADDLIQIDGTCKVGTNGRVGLNYYPSTPVAGIPLEKQILHVDYGEGEWKELFEDNEYALCYLHLGNDVTVNESFIIPENGLFLCEVGNVTVAEDVTITNHGAIEFLEDVTLTNNGNIANYGKMYIFGSVCNNGNIYAFQGSTVNVNEILWEGNEIINLQSGQIGGSCGEGVQWTYEQASGILTISGQGYMDDFEIGEVPWAAFAGGIKTVQVEDGILHVGNNAFRGLTELTRAVMADSVMNVAYAAFHDCTSLAQVTLSDTLDYIGCSAFSECDSLKTIDLPDTVRWIDGAAFQGSGLTSIAIPGTVTNITYNAFQSCEDLASVSLPDTLEYIDYNAFAGCSSLKNVSLPDSVMSLSYASFADCTSLESVRLSNSLSSISEAAFANCVSLKSISIPDSVFMIGGLAFMNCDSLTSVTIPDSVVTMGYPLGYQGFYSCDNLKTVKLSESLTMLPYGLFECCTSLERVRIPDSIEAIMPNVFANCGTIEKVVFEGDAPDINNSFRNTTANVYYPEEYAWTYDTTQDYAGNLTWMSYSDDLEIVSTNELDYVLSGKSIQLAAQDYTGIVEAEWEITAGAEYATINRDGLLTAKSGLVENQWIEVNATSLEDGASGIFELEILPGNSKLTMLQMNDDYELEVVDTVLTVDMEQEMYHVFFAQLNGEDVDVQWEVTDNAIIDQDGMIELIRPGTVTVIATGPYGITGTVTMDVYYVDRATKLTASAEVPAIGLQSGEEAVLTISGEQRIAPGKLEITVSDEDMAWVYTEYEDTEEPYFVICGGEKTGTVRITATLVNDPLNRSVTIPVKIIPAQTAQLRLNVWDKYDEYPSEVIYNKASLEGEAYTFTISAEATDVRGNWIETTKKSIRWTSSNTKLASIKVDEDGNAEVTIKKNADGEAVITAQTTDLAKVSASLTLKVQDLSPRLSDSKVTVNPMLAGGARLMLLPSYGNTIETVAAYTDSDYVSFEAQYDAETGVLQLNPEFYGSVRNGNYNVTLDVGCADGYWYEYPIKVTVKSVEPKVTVKQVSKYNLFYTDSVAEFDIAAADAEIEMLGLSDCDFSIYQDEETGRFYVCYDGYEDFATKQSDTKGTLYIYLEGYQYPVQKAVTIGTSNVKPKLVMSENGKTMVNIVLTQPLSGFQIYDASNNYEVITDAVGNRIEFTKNKAGQPFVSYWEYTDDNAIQMWLAENNGKYEGGTATVWVQKDNWTEAIKMTHKVTVQTKEPTLKAVNLELNNVFTWREVWQYPTVDQTNIGIARVENIIPKGKAEEGLEVWYENYRFNARIKDGATVKAGTYTYTGTPYMWSGYQLKDVTIKVKVVATVPTVKLNTTTVKLNSSLAGREVGVVATNVTNDYGFVLSGFTGMDAYEDAGVYLSYEDGRLEAKMDENAVRGKYAYTLYPQFRETDSDIHTATAPKALKLTVEVYDGKAISVTQSGKGKLDAIDPASQILYTISKISNAQGVVESVELIQGEEFFRLGELSVDAKGKQTFALMLKEDVTYSTKANYQVQFAYTICGQTVESAVLKVKVSQSSVKISAPAVNYYLSQSLPLNVQVSLTSPANAKIRFITVNADKTSKEFLQSIEKLLPGKSVGDLNFQFKEAHSLVAGKSYKLVLDITPVGHASDAKATQVTVNVKVMK